MRGLTYISLSIAEATPPGIPWWQVVTGILAIPTALLALVYTYRLYLKTHLEMRKLALEIIEKERELGIETAKPPAEKPPVTPSERYNLLINIKQNIEVAVTRPQLIIILAGLFSIGFALILPQPIALGGPKTSLFLIRGFSILIIGTVVFFSSKYLKRKTPWVVAALAITFFLLTILVTFSFLYVRSQYIVNYPPGETEYEIVTGTVFTEAALRYFAVDPKMSKEDLIVDFAGSVEDIWTSESIASIKMILLILYSASAILGSVLIVSLLHLIVFLIKRRKQSSYITSLEEDLLINPS